MLAGQFLVQHAGYAIVSSKNMRTFNLSLILVLLAVTPCTVSSAEPPGDADTDLACAELRAAGAELPPAGCWEEISNLPGCFLWNLYPKPLEHVQWSGACRNARAHGEGVAEWQINDKPDNVVHGNYENGRRHGQFLIRKHNGETWNGAYVRGKRQGPWIERYPDGSVAKGSMLYGKRHGWWLRRDTAGNAIEKTLWLHGEQIQQPK